MAERLLQLDDLRTIDSPERIASMFRKLGYVAEAQPFNIEDLDLSARNAEAISKTYLIANQGKAELQVFLFQLKPNEWVSPSTASTRMKAIASQLGRSATEFLLLATKDYNQLMLVNPRRTFDEGMNVKTSIRKLLIDRTNPTAYDRDRLEAIAAGNRTPRELYKTQCEAFDVEKLTKQFYRGYKELFDRVQAAVKKHNPHSYFNDSDRLHQFSQRLLGRVMFLYFLQKKEFLAGDRRFLTKQYEPFRTKPDDTNYYGEVLEPLFFETLNAQRPNFESRWGKIPYLNGGLFDRDYGAGIRDAAGRETPETLTLPNSLFDPGSSDGILGFFNNYNFTVSENVAGDEDVAVDPEMLGKVFENMLAAEERGQSGTFYTPRGIVQFMCAEVLTRYLVDESGMDLDAVRQFVEYDPDLSDADFNQLMSPQQARSLKKAVENIKVLDPAVGSGAFPLGMMQTILQVRQAIARREGITVQRGSLTISEWKREIIGNNLYGVDIKPEAIEIAKLRMWLSLVVDIPNIDNVEPLPNLDYKLMCGNSLISTIHGEQLIPDQTKTQQGMLAVTPIQMAIAPLLELEKRYFDVQSEERHQLREQILAAEANIFRVAVSDRRQFWLGKQKELEAKIKAMKGKVSKPQEKEKVEIATKLAELDKFATEVESGERSLNFFQYHLHFRDVFEGKGGFDVVIGNPPYGSELDEESKLILKNKFDYLVERRRNSYLYFIGLSYENLSLGGILSFIIPNEFLFAVYMSKARKFFLKTTEILYAINIGEKVFDAIVPTCLLSFKKNIPSNEKLISLLDLRESDASEILENLKNSRYNSIQANDILSYPKATFSFSNSKTQIINKLVADSLRLQDYCQSISQGITTSCDNIYIVSNSFAKQNLFEANYLKPTLKGGDFNRYFCPSSLDSLILYITSTFDEIQAGNIYNYLLSNRQKLISNLAEKNKGNCPWHQLFRGRKEEIFNCPKIIIRQTGDKIIAAIDDNVGYYCIDSVICAPLKEDFLQDIYFLLGLLNSKIINFFYREISQEKGRVLAQVKIERLKMLPLKKGTDLEKAIITEKVKAIIDNYGNKELVKRLITDIDAEVYKIYKLDNQTINLIENSL
jgi:adenine-specific DNA-methyltransferase